MAAVPLVEVQATRTQRPTAGTSYPYVDITVGDMSTQRVVQLQLDQVLHHCSQHTPFFFLLLQLIGYCVFVSRAWSCVASSPCKWKT